MQARLNGISCVFGAALLSLATVAAAAPTQWEGAPPAFATSGGTAVPIDMESVHVDFVFDAATQVASARAVVRFQTSQNGMPMFDLVPDASALSLDGQTLNASMLPTVSDPTNDTRMRVLQRAIPAGATHELIISYAVPNNFITWSGGRVRVGYFTSDLAVGGREFFEQYGPANFEFDAVAYTFGVRVTNTTVAHEVFTNGVLTATGTNQWDIDFADFYTTSSLYFHLADVGRFNVQHFDYQGIAATIPVTVYSNSATLTNDSVAEARRVLAELEGTYGASTHRSFTIYVTPSGGGMEHCGATMTSLWALSHELTHSWFARGVMPANGNSGWIDEAIASWRDNGYPRASSAPSRSPVNLGGFSAFRRHTADAAYTSGARLISELDFLAANNGGMKTILRRFHDERQRTTITNDDFRFFLEASMNRDLATVFDRYVYGRNVFSDLYTVADTEEAPMHSLHPRPFTAAELVELR